MWLVVADPVRPGGIPLRNEDVMAERAPESSRTVVVAVVAAALVAGAFLRLAALGADPSHPLWWGWIVDEGRWTEVAREWALFGRPDLDSYWSRVHLAIAPAFQAAAAAVFGVFGVSMATARLVSAVSGVLIVVVGWNCVRGLRRAAVLAAVVLLALQPDLVLFSRVAIPEMPALLMSLAGFSVLVRAAASRRDLLVAGLLLGVALAMKATVFPVIVVFAAVAAVVSGSGGGGRRHSAAAAWTLAPVAVVGVVAGAAVLWMGRGGGGGIDLVASLWSLIQPDSLYGVFAQLHDTGATVGVNALLVPVLVLAASGLRTGVLRRAGGRLFVGSLIWVVVWVLAWALLLYFPERYVAHIYVPLCLALGSGLHLLLERESDVRGAGGPPARDGFLRRMGAALPVAGATAPVVIAAAGLMGPAFDQFRFHAAAVLGIVLVLAFAAGRARRTDAAELLASYGLTALGVWLAVYLLVLPSGGYWNGSAQGLMLWGLAHAVAAVVTWMLRGHRARLSRVVVLYVVLLATAWSVRDVRAASARTYHMAQAAEVMTERYPPETVIGSGDAASVFLDTPFRYRELGRWEEGMPPGSIPSVMLLNVAANPDLWPYADGRTVVARFRLSLGPDAEVTLLGGEPLLVLVEGAGGSPAGNDLPDDQAGR